MPNFPAVDATGAFINPDVLTRLDERFSSGGAALPGRMVWRADYTPSANYVHGDVVRTELGLFVAQTAMTGIVPALPTDTFADNFERQVLGDYWQVNTNSRWYLDAGFAKPTGADPQSFLVKTDLSPDGTVTITDFYRASNEQTSVIFGWVDGANYYRLRLGAWGSSSGQIDKIVGGTATTLASSNVTVLSHYLTVKVTKAGGQITATYGAVTLTATDPNPLNGTGWGVAEYKLSGNPDMRIGAFRFDPAFTSNWSVIERRWALDSLTDVQSATALDGQSLAYDADTETWMPYDLPTSLNNLTDVTASGALSGDVLTFNGTGWAPAASTGGGGGDATLAPAVAFGVASVDTGASYTASTTAFAFKGEQITASRALDVTSVSAHIDLATGASYQAVIATLAGNTVDTVVAASAPFTSPATATQQRLYLPVSVRLAAGVTYVVLVGRTDGAGTFPLPINHNGAAGRTMNTSLTRLGTQSVRVAVTGVSAGTVLDIFASSAPAVVGLEFTTPGQLAVNPGNTVEAVVHGTNGSAARPANALVVHWYGSAEPVNATARDEWIQE